MADINDSTKKTTKSLMGGLLSLLRGSNKDSEILGKNASDSEVLGGIYKLMVQKENLNRLDYDKRKNYAEEEESEQARRHAEIVKALTVRRKPAPKKAKAKKPFRLPTLPGRKPVPRVTKPSAPAAPKPAPVPKPAEPTAPTVPKPSAPAPNTAAQEAARRAQEETARKAREEATRKAQEESARKAREEATRKAQEEAARKAREEATRKAQEEAARKAREEAVRKSQEEATRKAQEEAARKAREAAEAARKAREAREAAEAAKKAKDAEETARKAREAAEAARKARDAEEAAKKAREAAEAARKAREAAEAAKKTREAEETAKKAREAAESARKAREAAEAAKKAREVDKRRNDRTTEEEKGVRAAGEAAKREADRRAREEATRKAREEADRRAREEAARKSAERVERKPDQPPTAQPAAPSAPPSATRVPSTPGPATAGAVVAAAGLAAAFPPAIAAVIKNEQNVTSPADAISPAGQLRSWEKRKKEFNNDPNMPKVGAATPDVGAGSRSSTSYGLFGINNIRAKDRKTGLIIPGSSTIDSFIKMFPSLGLPDPGDPTNPEQVKKFNESWWATSKKDPVKMMNAQIEFMSKKFFEPAVKVVPEKFKSDPGVQLYMLDRRVQYGGGFVAALNFAAQNAKTPSEYVDMISDYDLRNLRSYYSGTSDEKYKQIERGLIHRVESRRQQAKKLMSNTTLPASPVDISSIRNNLSQMSSNNSDMRRSMNTASSSTVVINQQNTVAEMSTQQQNRDVVDDSSPYSRKSRA